ncbi:uncharacterized protein Fife isoform X6 [Hetaerina americana]|uniref:uncharacterized protein Fife isoform X6 n=1 Tax=Hetaerina americana TaxID=62018 RepID=UPI003A7F4AB2
MAMQHLSPAEGQPPLRHHPAPPHAHAGRAPRGSHPESICRRRCVPSTRLSSSQSCCSIRYPIRDSGCRRDPETTPLRCAAINTTARRDNRNQWWRYSHCAHFFSGSSPSVTRYAPPFRCLSCLAAGPGKETGTVYVKTKTATFYWRKRRRKVSLQHGSGQSRAETANSCRKQRVGGGEAPPDAATSLPRRPQTTKLRRGVRRQPPGAAGAPRSPRLRLRPLAAWRHTAGRFTLRELPEFDEASGRVTTFEHQPEGFNKSRRARRQRWFPECGRRFRLPDGSFRGERHGGRPKETTWVTSYGFLCKGITCHSCSHRLLCCCPKVSLSTTSRCSASKCSKTNISWRCRSHQNSDRRCGRTPTFTDPPSNPIKSSSRAAPSCKTSKGDNRKVSSDKGGLWYACSRRKRSCGRTTVCFNSLDCPWWTCRQSWPLSWRQGFRMVRHMPYRSQLRGSKCHCGGIWRYNRYTCGKDGGLTWRLLGRTSRSQFYSTTPDRCSSNGIRRQVTSLTHSPETSKNSRTADAGEDCKWPFTNASVVPRREEGVGGCSPCSRRPGNKAKQRHSSRSTVFGTIITQCLCTTPPVTRKWEWRGDADRYSRIHNKPDLECNLRLWRCKSRRFDGKFLRSGIMGPIPSFRTRPLSWRMFCGTKESSSRGTTSVVPSRGSTGNTWLSVPSCLTQRLPRLCTCRAGSPSSAQERGVFFTALLLRRGWWRCISSNWDCTKSGFSTHLPAPSRCSMGCPHPWDHKKAWLKPIRTAGYHGRRSNHTSGPLSITPRIKEELLPIIGAGERGKYSTGKKAKLQCSRKERINWPTIYTSGRNHQPSSWPKGKWAPGQNLKCNRFHTFDVGLGKEPVDFSLGAPHGTSTPSDDEEDDSWSTRSSRDETGKRELTRIILGPGQVQPRGFGMGHGFCAAEVKLGLLMSKGQLEVEVVCARNIAAASKDYPPDTYVKTYLRDGPRWLQKRKTRVVRRSMEPQYRQTLRYSARDVLGRSLLIMLWERTQRKSFVIGREPNQGLGGGEIALDRLQLTRLTLAWYPLFPLRSLSGAMANASDAYEGPRGPDGGPSSEEDDDGSEEPNLS